MSTPPYGSQDPADRQPDPPEPYAAPAPGGEPGGTAPLPSDPYGAPAPPTAGPYTEPNPPGYPGTPAPGRPPAYGQAPVPPPGYGQQPPGYPQQPPTYPGQQRPASERKGLAVAALVLGIVALLGSWIPFVNIFFALLAVVGLVLGIVAVVQASKGEAGGRGMAVTGIALSAVAIVLTIAVNVFFVGFVADNAPAIEQELERQLEEQGYTDDQIDEMLGNG